MPNINDINGVTVANLAKLDAVLKANISTVNGLTLAAAFTGLLDTYTGAAAAYSTRKLKTGVTVAARIRRSGDDIEADVEFDSNNEISLTSPISNASSGTYTDLADFVDHSTTPRNAFVDEWKDQSGSGNDAAQATAANQPKLYDATTGLITENGKPAIDWAGNKQLPTPLSGVGGSPAYTSFHVATIHSGGPAILMATTSTSFYAYGVNGDSGSPTSTQYSPATYYGNGSLISSATRGDIYNNHSSQGLLTVQYTGNANTYQFGYISSGFANFNCQECIIYHSDQTSSPTNNRTGIENNINGYFSIY